ncbi:prepilin-type N-terminal cleavage/methylation domain-containing protein [bacterium]|nr:prepilin-type N-terminal cleavage/methylation domain-containing protein [bacterium]
MKKTNFKAFTLVEMLIVIVIIGILIAALLPRLQGAQAMARDTARQTALTTIGTAIAAYNLQVGNWPWSGSLDTTNGNASTGVQKICDKLRTQGIISDCPVDRARDSVVSGLAETVITGGDFAYVVLAKNDRKNNGFMLMAATEMPGSSNWVVCPEGGGVVAKNADMKDLQPCSEVQLIPGDTCSFKTGGTCVASSQSQLRYVYQY